MAVETFLAELLPALGLDPAWAPQLAVTGEGDLPSAFAVTGLAVATTGAAGLAAAALAGGGEPPEPSGPRVIVDRRLASLWFASSIAPDGWTLPPPWDPVAGDYRAANGWIRLHTNAPHHRAAALAVLGVAADREAVGEAVARWTTEALETAVVAAGGCAAAMHDLAQWQAHPQGRAVASEPLVERTLTPDQWVADRARPADVLRQAPLAGVRVLDLTRVLAGPVATRFLAGLGAEVLRLDPPDWDEPAVVPDVTLGKRCARLDLREPAGRDRFLRLLSGADVLVHGYRPGALDGLGLGEAVRRAARPGLVDVGLDAYGWTGPWAGRRGFDSLVQMSSGIAAAGMAVSGADRPRPLPVQALDHAAGYLLAAAALRGVAMQRNEGHGSRWRTSLARVAHLLAGVAYAAQGQPLPPRTEGDLAPDPEPTAWGPARRLRPPVAIDGVPLRWALPASPLGSSPPSWA